MDNLLKDYLENNEVKSFNNVTIVSHNYNAHMCKVNFTYSDASGFSGSHSEHLNIWSVINFVYNNKNK